MISCANSRVMPEAITRKTPPRKSEVHWTKEWEVFVLQLHEEYWRGAMQRSATFVPAAYG